MTTLCNHGYFMHDCAICLKRDDECDYGTCTAKAVAVAKGSHESRRSCLRHAERVATTVGCEFLTLSES
jgi:hypothetical protein